MHLIVAFPDRVDCLLLLLFAFDSSFHTLISAKSLKPKVSTKNGTFLDQKTPLESSSSGFVKLVPLPFLMPTCGAHVAEHKQRVGQSSVKTSRSNSLEGPDKLSFYTSMQHVQQYHEGAAV